VAGGRERTRRGEWPSCCACCALASSRPPRPRSPTCAVSGASTEPDGQSARDDGPHGLDGRLGETAAPDAADPVRVAGASGGALRFEGGSFVRLPDAPELAVGTLTIEAVVRAESSPGRFRYVVSRGSHGCIAGSYGLYTGTAGGIAIYVFDGSRFVVSPIARPADVWDGAWHHVARDVRRAGPASVRRRATCR
jgi:hypothetical protein